MKNISAIRLINTFLILCIITLVSIFAGLILSIIFAIIVDVKLLFLLIPDIVVFGLTLWIAAQLNGLRGEVIDLFEKNYGVEKQPKHVMLKTTLHGELVPIKTPLEVVYYNKLATTFRYKGKKYTTKTKNIMVVEE